MKKLLLFSIIIVFLGLAYFLFLRGCNSKNFDLKFEPFVVMNTKEVNGLGEADSREKYYLVSGFNESDQSYKIIDSFVCTLINPDTIHFNENDGNDFRRIFFYKKTKKTNSDYIREWPREFFLYSIYHDAISCYFFEQRGMREKYIYAGDRRIEVTNRFTCGKE